MSMFMRADHQPDHPFVASAMACGVAFCFLAALSTSASCALAQAVAATPPLVQPSPKAAPAPAAAKNPAAAKTSTKPEWQDLTPSQQLSLKPLAANWKTLGEGPKRKWIAIAASYPTLSPAEQTKLHSRMAEWVSLSQKQREQARLNFAKTKALTPSQKTATWEAYQALSAEDRKKLAISATPKPTGAAAATKPVPPQKLAIVPMTKKAPAQLPRVSAANHAVNRNTLLPQSQPPVELAPAQKN